MTEKEFLISVKEYIEDIERHGNGYIQRDYYRDLKDLLHDAQMPPVYYACVSRLKKIDT